MRSFTIPKPFDMHVHFRQGEMLKKVVRHTADQFSYALVMPNTHPPIVTPDDVTRYQKEICHALHECQATAFTPLMTFKILPDTDSAILSELQKRGAIAGKVYPKGLTTNAEDGVEDFFALSPVFAKMEELGIVLCFHGEMPGTHIEGMDREREFLRTLRFVAKTFPKLRIVMEHITTAAAVDAVLDLPDTVAATITVHHLKLTHDDVGADRMRPHNFCKPVAKFKADRDSLIQAAISGCPKFFFGSDSAPHPKDKKECSECCAGVFTGPVALPLLAQIFDEHHALERLRKFVYDSTKTFYSIDEFLALPPDYLHPMMRVFERSWTVPQEYDGVVPFMACETLAWSAKHL